MRSAAAVLLIATLATRSIAQMHRESATVEVVQVPVYVSSGGRAVEKLTAANFELRVNGKRRPIDYFDVVDFREAAVPQTPDAARQRRAYVLLFDLTFTSPASIRRAQNAALALLESAPKEECFAVATYVPSHGAELVYPLSRDQSALRRAVMTLQKNAGGDPLHIVMAATARAQDAAAPSGGGGRFSGNQIGLDPSMQAMMASSVAAEQAAEPSKRLVDDQLQALGALADRLAQIDGYKHVVLMSDGFDSALIHGVVARHGFTPGAPEIDPMRMKNVREMFARYGAAGVLLHTIDVRGVRHTFNDLENDALFMMAAGTGGRFVHNRNDLGAALLDLSASQQIVYVLGFRPRDVRKGENTIAVRVAGVPRDVELSYRRSFNTTPEAATAVGDLKIADIVMNDVPQSGPSCTLTTSPRPDGVDVQVIVPLRQLAIFGGTADLLLYVFDENGAVDFRELKVKVPANASEDAVLHEAFRLSSGNYTIKSLLIADGDRSIGVSRIQTTVP